VESVAQISNRPNFIEVKYFVLMAFFHVFQKKSLSFNHVSGPKNADTVNWLIYLSENPE